MKKLHIVFSSSGGAGVTSIVAMSLYFNPSALGIDFNPLSRHLSHYNLNLLGLEELPSIPSSEELEGFVFRGISVAIEKLSSSDVQDMYIDLGTSLSLPFFEIIKDKEMQKAIYEDGVLITLHPVITPSRPSSVTSESLFQIIEHFSQEDNKSLVDIVLWLNEYNSKFASTEKVKEYMNDNIPGLKKIVEIKGFSSRERDLIDKVFKEKDALKGKKESSSLAMERGLLLAYELKMKSILLKGGLVASSDKNNQED